MGQSEFQTKYTIQKLLYSKGDIQWWPWNCPKLLFDFHLFHKRITYYYILLFIYWTYATRDYTQYP